MGQIEVYEYLKKRRLVEPLAFFSVKDICLGMKEAGSEGSTYVGAVGLHCAKLEADGYLEVVYPGKKNRWRRHFRLKKKYCKGAKR